MYPKGFNVAPGVSEAFANQNEGQMLVPAKLETQNPPENEMKGLDNPTFLATKEQKAEPNRLHLPHVPLISPNFYSESVSDVKKMKSLKMKSKQTHDQLCALRQEKSRLKEDFHKVTKSVSSELQNLLDTKRVGQKLEGLLKKYTRKIQHDKIAALPLIDRVQIKRELKEKLLREVEGLRTSGTQYENVAKVDREDLKKMTTKIKKSLGY